jgi:hypothetical protein
LRALGSVGEKEEEGVQQFLAFSFLPFSITMLGTLNRTYLALGFLFSLRVYFSFSFF